MQTIQANSTITISLSSNELVENDELLLTKTQINKLKKSKANGVGSDIKISRHKSEKLLNKVDHFSQK